MTKYGIRSEAGNRGVAPRARHLSSRTHLRRHRVLIAGVTLVSILYTLRLGQLQILEGARHREARRVQSAEWRELPAARGRILDRSGRVLVDYDTRHEVYLAVKELVVSREDALSAVASVVDVSSRRRRAALAATRGWTRIANDVSDEERLRLENSLQRGLHFRSRPARAYPSGSVARLLIGGVGSEGFGRTGLELHLDPLLQGVPGRAEFRFDGKKNAYRSPRGEVVKPRAGHTVVLTIHAGLQRIAENELQRAISETGSTAGDIVLLNPRTGELLAVASVRVDAAPGQVPAFSDPYEPGSTLKPFLLASLLSEGAVDLDEVIDVEGGTVRMGARTIRDVHGYDELTVSEIIARSSNVGAAKLSSRLTPAIQHRYLRDFGFGMKARLEYMTESAGHLSRPGEWTALSPASHAMGYEMSATSLQLAAAYGAIANDGILMQPTLIKEIRDAGGRVVQRFEPRAVRQVISPEVAGAVREVLAEVVRTGTGSLAQMASLAVAGKTGTARLAEDGGYARGHYRASFVGFAPADDPRVVILTRLEDPAVGSYYGGAIAAPMSQATLQAALAVDGMQIDPRHVVSGSPRRWTGRVAGEEQAGPFIFAVNGVAESWSGPADDIPSTVALPNLTGLSPRSATAWLYELGLRVEWRGSESVREQSPPAGSVVSRGGMVVLR